MVTPPSAIAFASAAGSYLATSRTLAPTINVMIKSEMPTIWEIGSTQYCVSSGVILRIAAVVPALNSRLRWVNITPFGVPVVPEV
jgi:hypothetical protein